MRITIYELATGFWLLAFREERMIIIFVGVFLLILSFLLAVGALSDLETPQEVRKLMRKKSPVSGVIVFFKKKVVHYRG